MKYFIKTQNTKSCYDLLNSLNTTYNKRTLIKAKYLVFEDTKLVAYVDRLKDFPIGYTPYSKCKETSIHFMLSLISNQVKTELKSKKAYTVNVTDTSKRSYQSIDRKTLYNLYCEFPSKHRVSKIILAMLHKYPFFEEIPFQKTDLLDLFESATKSETDILKKYLKYENIYMNLSGNITSMRNNSIIEMACPRTFGKYSDVSLYLSSNYIWEIFIDESGVQCLTARSKIK